MAHDDVGARSKKLVGAILDAMTEAGGTPGLPYDKLIVIVSADPEAAANAVPALLKAGEHNRGLYQIAQAVAGAYEVETKDDSLARMVNQVVSKLKDPLKPIRFLDVDAPPGTAPVASLPVTPRIGLLEVDPKDLANGDVFPFVRIFRADEARLDVTLIKGLRGKVIMTFPVNDDPRPVWQIPSVRTHQQKLFAQVPYFPYYLDPNPKAGMFLTFFGPLADPDAVNEGGVNLGHPSVLDAVVTSMKAVAGLATRLGESPDEVCRSILQALHGEYVDDVLTRAHV